MPRGETARAHLCLTDQATGVAENRSLKRGGFNVDGPQISRLHAILTASLLSAAVFPISEVVRLPSIAALSINPGIGVMCQIRTLLRRVSNAEQSPAAMRIPDAPCWRSFPPRCYHSGPQLGQWRGHFNGADPGPCPALEPLRDGFSLEVSRRFGRQEGVVHH